MSPSSTWFGGRAASRAAGSVGVARDAWAARSRARPPRIFATELVNNGLPIHIGAALLGHLNLETTRGYVAVFEEELVRHYQAFLDRRRSLRPSEEYRPTTDAEWREFQQHFDKRKVELGSCGRPYGTPCVHEHAGVRCPMLHVSPTMIGRLDELEADLIARRGRAHREGWLGEIEGLDLTLSHLRGKREQTRRLARATGLVEPDGPDNETRSDDVRGGEGVRGGAERTAH